MPADGRKRDLFKLISETSGVELHRGGAGIIGDRRAMDEVGGLDIRLTALGDGADHQEEGLQQSPTRDADDGHASAEDGRCGERERTGAVAEHFEPT